MAESESKPNAVSIDWLVKILVGVCGFFLAATFFTVQQTGKDVVDLKTEIVVLKSQVGTLKGQYHEVSQQLADLQHQVKNN